MWREGLLGFGVRRDWRFVLGGRCLIGLGLVGDVDEVVVADVERDGDSGGE